MRRFGTAFCLVILTACGAEKEPEVIDNVSADDPSDVIESVSYTNVSGTWIDDEGDELHMVVDSAGTVSGNATVDGVLFTMSGAFSGPILNLHVAGHDQILGVITGQWDGMCHIRYDTLLLDGSFNSGRMHVNHQPGEPCS